MSMFREIPNDHEPNPDDLPKRYWPALPVWDVVEMVQGAPVYMVEFIRSTNMPLPRTLLVQEDLVLFDLIQQIGIRWIHKLKVFNPVKYLQESEIAVVHELWHADSRAHGKGVALVRDRDNRLYTPSVLGVEPEGLLQGAKLVWHRTERVKHKH
jgi:hypothetical protein